MDKQIDFIYRAWDDALARSDVEALLALYGADATLDSPLVPHLMASERGIVRGHEQLRRFFGQLAERKPPVRRHFRTGFLSDGRLLVWEYPREAPDGEQMDFVEVMEIADGLIQRQRVYWGWFGVNVLLTDRYHR
jgi:ketosteroid isomerase-like protein